MPCHLRHGLHSLRRAERRWRRTMRCRTRGGSRRSTGSQTSQMLSASLCWVTAALVAIGVLWHRRQRQQLDPSWNSSSGELWLKQSIGVSSSTIRAPLLGTRAHAAPAGQWQLWGPWRCTPRSLALRPASSPTNSWSIACRTRSIAVETAVARVPLRSLPSNTLLNMAWLTQAATRATPPAVTAVAVSQPRRVPGSKASCGCQRTGSNRCSGRFRRQAHWLCPLTPRRGTPTAKGSSMGASVMRR
mmetsp:Transcript_40211/g.111727  ORF Transcript_40211/g.111727 Transcript_40211/m.111727 type:complete len:245 (+) Transcript_40211:224-958(+)